MVDGSRRGLRQPGGEPVSDPDVVRRRLALCIDKRPRIWLEVNRAPRGNQKG